MSDDQKETEVKKTPTTDAQTEDNKSVIIGLIIVVLVAVVTVFFISQGMESKTEDGTNTSQAKIEKSEDKTVEKANADKEFGEAGNVVEVKPSIEPGNPVVARIGNVEILRDEVFGYVSNLPPSLRNGKPEKIFPLALDQLVNEKILEMKLAEVDLSADPKVQEMLEDAKKQIVRSVYLEREMEKHVTEDKLREKYDKITASFDGKNEVRARHILVETAEEAQNLITELEGGADFAKLAKDHSKGPTGERGGDLGYFGEGEMVPPFSKAAFSLEKGEFTKEPVKTQFGYHVIMLEDKRAAEAPSFESIKQRLEGSLRQNAMLTIIEDWRDSETIEVFDINGKAIQENVEETVEQTVENAETTAEQAAEEVKEVIEDVEKSLEEAEKKDKTAE